MSQFSDSAAALNVCNFLSTNLSSCLALFSKRLEAYTLDIWHCALGNQRCVPENEYGSPSIAWPYDMWNSFLSSTQWSFPSSSASESIKLQVCQCPILHMEKGHYQLGKILQKWR